MAKAAAAAGVAVVTGDTKVVERGKGDGLFVNTTGIGLVPDGRADVGEPGAAGGSGDPKRADRGPRDRDPGHARGPWSLKQRF